MQMRYLGTFATEEEAARAFDQEGMRLRGRGIELNLPHEAEAFLMQLKIEEERAARNGNQLNPHPLPSLPPPRHYPSELHASVKWWATIDDSNSRTAAGQDA